MTVATAALLTVVSHARKRITYQRGNAPAKWRSLVYHEFIKGSARSMHTVDHHLAQLASLGVHESDRALALQLPNESRIAAERILSGSGPTSVFLCTSGDHARDVAARLAADHPVVLVANGPVAGTHLLEYA